MQLLFTKNFSRFILLIIFLGMGTWYYNEYHHKVSTINVVTTTVTLGTVRQTITVSGKIEANQTAKLGFSVEGIIQKVYKNEGDSVEAGEVIASLTSESLVAEYIGALSQTRFQEEIKNELIRGPLDTDRALARNNVRAAEANLEAIKADYNQTIKNTYRSLLTNDLQAYPVDSTNNDIPPTILGNYSCESEGNYVVSIYQSQSSSNYSYNLTGLENGTYKANIDNSDPLGTCGLYIMFSPLETYRAKEWVVEIPNRRSKTYFDRKNEYDLLLTNQATAIKIAEEDINLAKSRELTVIAPASIESIRQAEANLASAQATLKVYDAKIADYTIRAPFRGLISEVKMKEGEPVSLDHVVNIVHEGDYQLVAQIPEIDITKVMPGNQATVIFDAKPEMSVPAKINFIAPLSSTVCGVAYYEARFSLIEKPTWLRDGLNADVIIESEIRNEVPILPKRFINFKGENAYVILLDGNESIPHEQQITVDFIGTDGNVKVSGLPPGTKVILP